jgi:hypothetical protein
MLEMQFGGTGGALQEDKPESNHPRHRVCGTTGSNDFGAGFMPGAEESEQQLLKELESIVHKTNLETSETKKD